MNNVEVLISAMHQKDFSILKRTNVHSDALLINQCDTDGYQERKEPFGLLRILSTTERGISNSRNMALDNALGDFVLLCDDDEVLYEGYEEKIKNAFIEHSNFDVICFQIKCPHKKYSNSCFPLNYLTSLKISSWQIAFKLESIRNNEIRFDNRFGSGTPLGSGEENIFLYDCIKKKLKLLYIPICIGEVSQMKSNWFKGFNESYFFNRGKIIRRMMGYFWGSAYSFYFVVSKHCRYKAELNFFKALKNIFLGLSSR